MATGRTEPGRALSQASHRTRRARGPRWNESRQAERSRVAPCLGPPTDRTGLAAPVIMTVAGWEQFDVDADVGVRAWGPTRAEAFAQAALGVFALIVSPDEVDEREHREVRAQADSPETLLVNWINECLYVHEIEGFVAHRITVLRVSDTVAHGVVHEVCRSPPGPMPTSPIKRRVTREGVGPHPGKQARVTLPPPPEATGIVFRAGDDRITAAPESVVNSHYATTIGKNGTRVATVEHLLAAAAGLGIDNLEVGVEGPEIPAMDGSAKPFVALLAAAGRNQQSARRRSLTLPNAIRVGSDGRWIHIFPAPAFRISYTLDVDHPAIGTQVLTWAPATERSFVEDVAPARTYGFLKDLGIMRKNGLARGGSLDNAVVLAKGGPLNGLRYRDEFVRHKILDLIGDLALLGRPILAHVVARNGGHTLNVELVRAIQHALGLARRPVGAALSVLPRVPAPGLAAI